MKKVLLTLIAVLMAVPAFAIEVYNNGSDTTVDIYGTIRGYVGYGWAENSATANGVTTTSVNGDDMMYGLQGNSRLGVRFKVGQFSGNVEIGANEPTLTNSYSQGGSGIGFRHAWGAYDFGAGGKLLVGKTSTPTEMGGWSSDVFDNDGGLNGFGGNPTGDRRFQVQYSIAGFQIALVHDDNPSLTTGFADRSTTLTGQAYIPRLSAAYNGNYDFNSVKLKFKLGATYTAVNGALTDPTVVNDNSRWDTIHAFKIVAGIRPTFLGGKLWVSAQGAYGQNTDVFNQGKVGYSTGGFATASFTAPISGDRNSYNIEYGGLMAEVGYKITDMLGVVLGGGYQRTNYIGKSQYTATTGMLYGVDSYAVYFQVPITVNKYLSFHPQVTWYETVNASSKVNDVTTTYTRDDNRQTGVLAGMQMRVTF